MPVTVTVCLVHQKEHMCNRVMRLLCAPFRRAYKWLEPVSKHIFSDLLGCDKYQKICKSHLTSLKLERRNSRSIIIPSQLIEPVCSVVWSGQWSSLVLIMPHESRLRAAQTCSKRWLSMHLQRPNYGWLTVQQLQKREYWERFLRTSFQLEHRWNWSHICQKQVVMPGRKVLVQFFFSQSDLE